MNKNELIDKLGELYRDAVDISQQRGISVRALAALGEASAFEEAIALAHMLADPVNRQTIENKRLQEYNAELMQQLDSQTAKNVALEAELAKLRSTHENLQRDYQIAGERVARLRSALAKYADPINWVVEGITPKAIWRGRTNPIDIAKTAMIEDNKYEEHE